MLIGKRRSCPFYVVFSQNLERVISEVEMSYVLFEMSQALSKLVTGSYEANFSAAYFSLRILSGAFSPSYLKMSWEEKNK